MGMGGALLFLILLLIIQSLLQGNDIFSVENLITALIVVGLFSVIAAVLIIDYLPVYRFALARWQYWDDLDDDRCRQAIAAFQKKNRLPGHAWKGWLLQAQIELKNADYSEALDSLLFCRLKDMEEAAQVKYHLMRLKIRMFMDQLKLPNDDWDFVRKHSRSITLTDRYNVALLSGYLALSQGDRAKADQLRRRLDEYIKESGLDYSPRLAKAEAAWLAALIRASDGGEAAWLEAYNTLHAKGPYPYLLRSLRRREPVREAQ
jgi:hypothetical protein